MRIASLVIGAAALMLSGAAEAQGLRVGVAAPLTGPSAMLGEQIRRGANAAAEADGGIALDIADDACSADGGAKAAKQFIAQKTQIVVGFLCTEAIEAALPLLKESNIPVITVGVRADSLTDARKKTGWPVFRLGPRADGEREAAGTILAKRWRTELFAVIDDGTIYGRELAESVRSTVEQAGLKPVFVDTFRPQLDNQIGLVGRLRKAAATHVFVGGDRDDIAIMTRDARQIGANMIFAGGETLRAAPSDVALAQGTLMIALPEWADIADPKAVSKLIAEGTFPDGYVLPAYAAVEIAKIALAASADSGEPPAAILAQRDFTTVIGTIRFDDKGDLAENPYRAFRFNGSRFISLDTP